MPRPGIFFSRTQILDKSLPAEDWRHWENEVFIPEWSLKVAQKSSKGASGPTLLMRYANVDEKAEEEWRNLTLMICPDLEWFDSSLWTDMKAWQEPINAQVGSILDGKAVWSFNRTYEMLDFHAMPRRDIGQPFYDFTNGPMIQQTDGPADDRGNRIILFFETPTENETEAYHQWYTKVHSKDLRDIEGLHFMARAKYISPTSPVNLVNEDEALIPKFLTMYQFQNEGYDKEAFETSRSTKAADRVFSTCRHNSRAEFSMDLSAENEEANRERQKLFRGLK